MLGVTTGADREPVTTQACGAVEASARRDLNPRLYGFAGRSLGPLGHRRLVGHDRRVPPGRHRTVEPPRCCHTIATAATQLTSDASAVSIEP